MPNRYIATMKGLETLWELEEKGPSLDKAGHVKVLLLLIFETDPSRLDATAARVSRQQNTSKEVVMKELDSLLRDGLIVEVGDPELDSSGRTIVNVPGSDKDYVLFPKEFTGYDEEGDQLNGSRSK